MLFSLFSKAQTEPVAINDLSTTNINTTLVENTPGVLVNDTDADNNPLSVTSFSINSINYLAGETASFTQGSITINTDGSYSYTPSTNFIGNIDTVIYTISDGTFSVTANLQITVENLNEPEAFNDYDTAEINTTLSVSAPGVLVNDTDADNTPLTVTFFTINAITYTANQTANFAQGSITVNTDGSYTFIPYY